MASTNNISTPNTVSRILSFQASDPTVSDATKDNFDKSIQNRLRSLQAVLPDYVKGVNITEYVAELKVHCENSGLDNHRGLIIAALMKKCVSGSFLGRRVRASLKATEQAIIQEHVAAGGTPETAKTSWHDNTLAARYLQDVFSQLMDTADECTETNLDLKRRWRELRFLESESLVEYFDRSQDLTILLQERGIPKCSDDVVLDVLQGLRIRTDAVNPLFYTTLALTECTTLSDLRIRTRNLHRVMPAEFMSQIPLTAHERVSGEEAVRVAGLGDTQTPNSLKGKTDQVIALG